MGEGEMEEGEYDEEMEEMVSHFKLKDYEN
jgi:hypothetical protein